MKVIIAGTRTITDVRLVHHAVEQSGLNEFFKYVIIFISFSFFIYYNLLDDLDNIQTSTKRRYTVI